MSLIKKYDRFLFNFIAAKISLVTLKYRVSYIWRICFSKKVRVDHLMHARWNNGFRYLKQPKTLFSFGWLNILPFSISISWYVIHLQCQQDRTRGRSRVVSAWIGVLGEIKIKGLSYTGKNYGKKNTTVSLFFY